MDRSSSCLPALLFAATALHAQDPIATPAWRSSFETGFPGEWLNYDNGSYSASGANIPGRTEHWTIADASSLPAGGRHGPKVYKGWITGSAAESHRAYPGIHVDIPSPLVNSWWVYLDTDYARFPPGGWHHFATWGNNPDWRVQTMSVLGNGRLEMAHISNLQVVGDNIMPLRRWVRFTAYIAYAPNGDNTLFVWKDGQPCLRAVNVTAGGGNLMRAHWGLYTSGNLSEGVQYNDDIRIWRLSGPWTDWNREPPSPYGGTPILRSAPERLRSAPPRRGSNALFSWTGRAEGPVDARGRSAHFEVITPCITAKCPGKEHKKGY